MKSGRRQSDADDAARTGVPDAATLKSKQLYWIFQGVGWGLYTLIRAIAAIAGVELPWLAVTIELLVLDLAAFALSHALRWFVRKHRWVDLRIPQMAMRMIVAAVLLGIPLGFATQFTHVAALQDPTPMLQMYLPGVSARLTLLIQFALQMMNWAVLYMIWLVIYFIAVGLREYRSARLKQSELTRALQLAELGLLKSQLNPHFFFNALNTVRSLISENPPRAHEAVTRLANTLRHTLRSRQNELIPLSQELEIVKDYLALESMRFEDRLRTEIEIPVNASKVHVPVMLLQTLVENGIKHGIAELPAGGLLRIGASVEESMLIVEIQNSRPAAAAATGDGIGLRNARDRLRLLFGAAANLDLDLSRPDVATARLRIPRNS